MQRRRLTSFAVLLVVAIATTAVATAATPNKARGKKVTFVGPIVVPVWLQARDGFVSSAKKLGMKPRWTAPTTIDIPGNVQALETALRTGASGLVACALDPNAFEGVLKEAKKKKVPVILVDCDTKNKALRLAYVGTIGRTFGQKSGKKLQSLTGAKAKIIVMQGSFDAAIQNDILAGFKVGIADAPDMEIVARESDGSDPQVAVDKFQALFRTHPDATVVYCIEAGCAGAAATVAQEQGRNILIFGTDDNKETLDGIRTGTIAISAAQPFTKMGKLAAQYLARYFNGKKVPSTTDTGVLFITKQNVDTYLKDQ